MLQLHIYQSKSNSKVELGDWLASPQEQWRCSPSEDLLCLGNIGDTMLQRWMLHAHGHRGRSKFFQPAVVELHGASAFFSGSTPLLSPRPPLHDSSRFSKIWSSLPPEIQWLLENCEGWEHLEHLVQAHKDGHLIVSTDGSHKDGVGTAAWRIRDARYSSKICLGEHISPGSSIHQDSTRAELSGCHGIAYALHFISLIH